MLRVLAESRKTPLRRWRLELHRTISLLEALREDIVHQVRAAWQPALPVQFTRLSIAQHSCTAVGQVMLENETELVR